VKILSEKCREVCKKSYEAVKEKTEYEDISIIPIPPYSVNKQKTRKYHENFKLFYIVSQ